MKSKISVGMKKLLKTLPYLAIAILVGYSAVYAGSTLTAPHAPAKTMKSLADLNTLITTGAEPSSFSTFDTPSSVSLSMNSIDNIYGLVKTEITKLSSRLSGGAETVFGLTGNANIVDTSSGDATVSDILTGKKAWVDGVEVTGIASAGGGVTKTGQSLCWNTAGTAQSPCLAGGSTDGGQDGYYSATKGTALSYTDNGNATITDNVTGLMWKKCSEGKTGNTCATGSSTTKTWTEALAACEADTTATFTDWRLPNMRELISLVDYGRVSPAINPLFSTESDVYWSSTTYIDNPLNAWSVIFNDGNTYLVDKTFPNYYVRCVRG